MNNSLVSIVTPAFNCKNTIEETYLSIKNQTFKSWEWIVVDDHSTDGTFDLVKQLAKNDKRIIVLQTEKNSGAAVTRNVGIEKASGRFIAFLDSDDMWKEDKLEKQIAFMKNNDYQFTFSNYELFYENGNKKQYRIKKDCIKYKDLLKTNSIGCLTAVYDADSLGKIYMPLDCEKREDHGAWLDILKKGVNAYRLDEYLAIYRVGNSSVSSNKRKMLKYQYRLYRKHEGFNVIKSTWYLMLCVLNKIFKKY